MKVYFLILLLFSCQKDYVGTVGNVTVLSDSGRKIFLKVGDIYPGTTESIIAISNNVIKTKSYTFRVYSEPPTLPESGNNGEGTTPHSDKKDEVIKVEVLESINEMEDAFEEITKKMEKDQIDKELSNQDTSKMNFKYPINTCLFYDNLTYVVTGFFEQNHFGKTYLLKMLLPEGEKTTSDNLLVVERRYSQIECPETLKDIPKSNINFGECYKGKNNLLVKVEGVTSFGIHVFSLDNHIHSLFEAKYFELMEKVACPEEEK